ncbi:quinolinate synthase A [Bacteroidia bacterium]|nr:quinolinate synthase A [Bacteroidia bacterium]
MKNIIEQILRLKKEKNAVILGHYYINPELQDISDFVGDSLALSKQAMNTSADIIVFCGVYFMAETAKILNPTKKVLIPDVEAGCSLADSCSVADVIKLKEQHPNAIIISYINCSAEVKTISDIICTSGNALQLVKNIPAEQEIIFVPDKNLGGYINRMLGRNMILSQGSCHVHNQLKTEQLLDLKKQYPTAKIIAHPECAEPLLLLADFVGSTAAMLDFINKDSAKEYIVATETGIVHQMTKHQPNKIFHIVATDKHCACNDCSYMKLNSLEKLYHVLETEENEIILTPEIMHKATPPLLRMLSHIS